MSGRPKIERRQGRAAEELRRQRRDLEREWDRRYNASMTTLPVACTLSPEALKGRKENLLSVLVGRAVERKPLADGYRLRFSSDGEVLSLIARAIDAERQCCRFLRFMLTVEPDGGMISLDLTGPTGTREFLSAMLES